MKKKKIGTCVALLGITLMSAQVSFADVTAVYKMTSQDGNGTQTIHYVDKQHVRVDMANDSVKLVMSMLKLGDKVYSITGKTVQDMSQLADMMAAMGNNAQDKHNDQPPIKYKDTGRTETIAGIKGKVYHFTERGKQHEVVFGQDKDLQAAALGLVEISKSSFGINPEDSTNLIQQDASIKNMAMLRLDNIVRLQSINKDHIQDSVFELPSKPQQLGGMGALLQGMMDNK